MALFRTDDVVGRSPDGNLEVFDFQTPNTAHDIVFARLDGHHDGGRNQRSTFTYAVCSGDLTVTVDGASVKARAGDVITVNPGSHKMLDGRAQLFIICSPPFDPADEVE
jgi:mannose-6-phosphate isomerase-like protein (cupin superfamily)